jgi:hypothetical protein
MEKTIWVTPNKAVTIRVDDDDRMVRWQAAEHIPEAFLARNRMKQDKGGRAPLGDSHGAWQEVAEIPLSFLMEKLPPDAWEDEAALRRLVNDPDLKAFRTDAPGRVF